MTFSFARFRYLSIQLAIVFLLSIGAMPTAYANEVGREQLPSISAQTAITETGATTETKESGVKLPGFGREPAAPADEAAPTPTPAPTEEPAALGPIDNLEDAQSAVIQIEAVGTFEDPEEGLIPNAAGRGSGFIIDPSGIAVTNNHVVTGAAFLKVFVAGEDEPRNARVLGVSECSDLAVIDIQGDGFPYLTWYKGTIKVGLDVYAAGFPLGDPEYTLTRGIVSKAQANGDTSWASVDSVLQHDATINRGNSGGPLIDADGAVVAVNYAGNASTNQYFAISSVDAIPIVENLMTGSDVNALGINGQAVSDGEQLSGIWVASVKSGSPADQIGIKSGDIIVTMEGVQLATDGTMADYCNILRSHDAEDVLTVQVLRFDTKEMLEGQINGRVLEQSFSFADTLEEDNGGGESNTDGNSETSTTSYSDYTSVADATGVLSVEVPVEWTDVRDGNWTVDDQVVGLRLAAAPDLDAFFESWSMPGVIFSASADLLKTTDEAGLLDSVDYSDSCTFGERKELPDGHFTGLYDRWEKCGDAESSALIVAVAPQERTFVVLIEMQVVSDADLEAVDHILDSFVVDGLRSSAAQDGDLTSVVDTSGLMYEYTPVQDGAVTALVPSDWTDVESDDWLIDDEPFGKEVTYAVNVSDFRETWTGPGVLIQYADVTDDVDVDNVLDSYDLSESCTHEGRQDHEHTVYGVTYTGKYDVWTDCQETGNAIFFMAATTGAPGQVVLVELQAATEGDVEAFDVVAQSVYVEGEGVSSKDITSGSAATDYVLISDDAGLLTAEVPETWDDVYSGEWLLDDGPIGIQLSAATDLEGYDSSWEVPGMFIGLTDQYAGTAPADVLDAFDYTESCDEKERFDYEDEQFVGKYDIWSKCGNIDAIYVVLAINPTVNTDLLSLITVQIPDDSYVDAFEHLLETVVVGDLSAEGSASEPISVVAAVVQVDTLNVRSGPGTNYSIVTQVRQGNELRVTGQVDNCGWLQIVTDDGAEGWVSGNARFTALAGGSCSDVPRVAAPSPPAASTSSGTNGSVSGNARQGCYLFQNQLGSEITITLTRGSDGWNRTFKVGKGVEQQECFDPGKYTYTLDAPPPWGSSNGELEVAAGDRYLFPIRGE